MIDILLRVITGLIGTIGFAIIFNVRGKFLIFASLGGLFSILAFELLILFGLSDGLSCFIVASLITLYSEILARIVKTPTTTFIITALIPLIPGSALYYSMSNALEKNRVLFLENAYYAFKIAISLAVGIIFVTTSVQLSHLFLNNILKKIKENKHNNGQFFKK